MNQKSSKKDSRKGALHRIKIIAGHLKKLEKMLEENRYCVDVMIQSMAIQSSLKSLNQLLLKEHLRSCVKDQFLRGDCEQAVEELGRLYSFEK